MSDNKTPFYRHLTDDGLEGDGSNFNANVNGSVTPVPFYAGPASGKIWRVERMIVSIEDNAVFNAEDYGGISTLSNGILVQRVRSGVGDTVITDLLDGRPIKSMVNWASFCYDGTYSDFGAGNNFYEVRWTFSKTGTPLKLSGHRQEKLVATIRDNLSTLVSHTFHIQGIEEDE